MSTHCGKENAKVENGAIHCRSTPLPAEHDKKGKEKEATIPPAIDDPNYSFACPDPPSNPGLVKVPPNSAIGNCYLPILTAKQTKRKAGELEAVRKGLLGLLTPHPRTLKGIPRLPSNMSDLKAVTKLLPRPAMLIRQ